MANRVTLKDVAREAGVHTSTASRALNPDTRSVVNPDTVARVLEVARDLGYRPHPLARGLRTNQTMSVGVVIPDIENPLFGQIIAGVDAALADRGYSVLIGNTDRNDEEHMRGVIAAMVERRVDGLILATASRTDAVLGELVTEGIPIVLVNRTTDHVTIPSIIGDDHAGMGLSTRHVAELGHTRVGHLAGPRWLSTGLGRYRGFMSWAEALGLDVDEDAVEEADWYQVDPGYRAATALLDRRPDLTAIVTANDLIALGAYRAIRERGLEVGADVSVTGYNDMALLDLLQPPLTSVAVPYRRMGEEAARTLLAVVEHAGADEVSRMSMQLPPTLVVRGSTGPPRG